MAGAARTGMRIAHHVGSILMNDVSSVQRQLKAFHDDFGAMRRELGKAVVGIGEVVEHLLLAAVCGGHVLVEGPPGVGKTRLVERFAAIAGLSARRIQFTADLTPADLIGTHVIMETPQGRRTFEFQQGPIFAQVVLADHINRGLPKTQAALLEAMEGDTVSVSTETFRLPEPHLVFATQNPAESDGVFPLPDAELDRFFFKLVVAPPGPAEIEAILERTTEPEDTAEQPVTDGRRLLEMRRTARAVACGAALRRRVAELVAATHPGGAGAPEEIRRWVAGGASPRGAQAIVLAAKARAASAGRAAVEPEDIRAVARAALRHRLALNFEGQAENVDADRLVDSVVERTELAG